MNAIAQVQRFGEFELDRAAHELRRGGRPIRLEGRAMTLLMLLLERPGQLVTRAEIVERLWGSDAFVDVESGINTAVRKLRAALGDRAENPTMVGTVQGRGYRLIAPLEPEAATAAVAKSSARRPPYIVSRHLRWAGVFLAVAAVAILLAGLIPRRPSPPRVQVLPMSVDGGGGQAQAFADVLSDRLTARLGETGVQVAPPPRWVLPSLRRQPPDLTFGGGVSERAGATTVQLFLQDARADVTLWSRRISGPSDRPERLAEQAAAQASDTLATALDAQSQRGVTLDPATLGLYIRGAQVLANPGLSFGSARSAFEKVSARAPDFALGHAYLAAALAIESTIGGGPDGDAVARRAEQAARIAIRLDPSSAGPAYSALAWLERRREPGDIWAMQQRVREGLNNTPQYAAGHARECQLLGLVGRFDAATPHCVRAAGLRPASAPLAASLAETFAASGRYALAREQIEKAAQIDPTHPSILRGRFFLEAIGGGPDAALQILDDPWNRRFSTPDRALKLYLTARKSGSTADAQRAAKALAAAAAERRLALFVVIPAMATIGRGDAALDVLMRLPPDAYRGENAGFLTYAASAPLRQDSRYWTIAARAGLVRYWIKTNTWPDFCSDPRLDCRARASRAAALEPSL